MQAPFARILAAVLAMSVVLISGCGQGDDQRRMQESTEQQQMRHEKSGGD